jgi:hypothetical protein
MNLYNTIQKVLNTASSHILVNEVGEGDIYEYLNSGEHKYPCVFLTVTSVVDNEYTRNINGTLFYVDRLLANQSNKTSIQSVAVSVLRDMLQALNVDVDTIEYNTFTEKFTDLGAGAYVDCQIPIDFTSLCEDNFEMKVKSITENGIYEIEGYDAVDVKVVDKESQLVIEELEDRINSVTGLTITDNGVYTPPEGVLGYDNIDVNVVPKVVLGNELKLAYSTYTEVPDNFDFSQTTIFDNMFNNCTELTKVPTLDTSNSTSFENMFQLCHKLRTIPYLDTSNGGWFNNMFNNCWGLETITHLDTTKGKLFDYMFSSCESLEVIGGELDFSNGGTYLSTVFGLSFQAPAKLREVRFKGSINGTINFYCPVLSYDSIKSILTACTNKTRTNATTLTFDRTIADNNGELADLIAQCNAKNWTISGLTLQ